jgi:hypothetical protein
MDPDKKHVLDQLIERAAASALKSLDAVVDVEQQLRDLYQEAGLDPELVQDHSTPRRK